VLTTRANGGKRVLRDGVQTKAKEGRETEIINQVLGHSWDEFKETNEESTNAGGVSSGSEDVVTVRVVGE
jgi:hypothetical protein